MTPPNTPLGCTFLVSILHKTPCGANIGVGGVFDVHAQMCAYNMNDFVYKIVQISCMVKIRLPYSQVRWAAGTRWTVLSVRSQFQALTQLAKFTGPMTALQTRLVQ